MSNGVEDELKSQNGTVQRQDEEDEFQEVEPSEQGETEEDGVEAVGSVNTEHNIVDQEGNVLGQVGEEIPEGSLVDTEGDVLDQEGNVIGKADLANEASEGVADKTKENAEGQKDKAEGSPSEVPEQPDEGIQDATGKAEKGVEGASGEVPDNAESGVEDTTGKAEEGAEQAKDATEELVNPLTAGPFTVGEGGEITNAAGAEIGQLAEGEEAQDLAGKDIVEVDQEGNLRLQSGSVVGQADINADILDEAKEATKVPMSALEGLKVNKAGKIVDEEVYFLRSSFQF